MQMKLSFILERGGWVQEAGGTAVDTSVSFARRQQGEQTVAVLGVVF